MISHLKLLKTNTCWQLSPPLSPRFHNFLCSLALALYSCLPHGISDQNAQIRSRSAPRIGVQTPHDPLLIDVVAAVALVVAVIVVFDTVIFTRLHEKCCSGYISIHTTDYHVRNTQLTPSAFLALRLCKLTGRWRRRYAELALRTRPNFRFSPQIWFWSRS